MYDADKINALDSRPADFDAYWASCRAQARPGAARPEVDRGRCPPGFAGQGQLLTSRSRWRLVDVLVSSFKTKTSQSWTKSGPPFMFVMPVRRSRSDGRRLIPQRTPVGLVRLVRVDRVCGRVEAFGQDAEALHPADIVIAGAETAEVGPPVLLLPRLGRSDGLQDGLVVGVVRCRGRRRRAGRPWPCTTRSRPPPSASDARRIIDFSGRRQVVEVPAVQRDS